jgi:Secretion system C-terminal sorting domain
LSDTDQYHSQLPSINAESDMIAAIWMDFKYASPGSPTGDIFLRQSADSGQNWAEIEELNSDHSAFQSDVTLNSDTIHLVWEDETPGVSNTRIQYQRSTDSGRNWDASLQLDDTPDESRYPAIAAARGCIYAIWCDSRTTPDTSGVYFSRWPELPDQVIDEGPGSTFITMGISAYPNPFNSDVTIAYCCTDGGDIEIFNTLGQVVRKYMINSFGGGKLIWDGTDESGNLLSSGVYYVKLQAGWKNKSVSIIFMK